MAVIWWVGKVMGVFLIQIDPQKNNVNFNYYLKPFGRNSKNNIY